MMASLKFALLLSFGLFGCALTSAVEIELTMDPDVLENKTTQEPDPGDHLILPKAGLPERIHPCTGRRCKLDTERPWHRRPPYHHCQNCAEIFELFADMFSNPDLQDQFMDEEQCLDPTASPTVSKMCNREVQEMLPLALNMVFAAMVQRNGSIDPHSNILSNGSVAENQLPKGPFTCILCKTMMKVLIQLLPETQTEEIVLHFMKKVCHIMPVSVRPQCTILIDKYGKEILDFILKGAGPSVICLGIRLC